MAHTKTKKSAGSVKGKKAEVFTFRLSPLIDLLGDTMTQAQQLQQVAANQADVDFLQKAELILTALNQAQTTLRLCPQNQFRNIVLKQKARSSGKAAGAKKIRVAAAR